MYLSTASKLQLPQLNRTESTGPIVHLSVYKINKTKFYIARQCCHKSEGKYWKIHTYDRNFIKSKFRKIFWKCDHAVLFSLTLTWCLFISWKWISVETQAFIFKETFFLGPWTCPYKLPYIMGQYRHLPDFFLPFWPYSLVHMYVRTYIQAADNLCFDREQTSTFTATFTFGF